MDDEIESKNEVFLSYAVALASAFAVASAMKRALRSANAEVSESTREKSLL